MNGKTLTSLAALMENSLADLQADCIALAIPSPFPGCVFVLARGQSFPDAPELVPVSTTGNSLCQKVLQSGEDVQAHFGSTAARCGLMAAEELSSYCGTPVFAPDGSGTLASLSAMTRMSRIWSRGDRDRLHGLAAEIARHGIPIWAGTAAQKLGDARR
ncbi:hypothetical protein [Mangrovicoccus ximenensis]|uniref:hypothetical protein n=1 Tax=Mangrovicoccus ximenensis TaxID=1911570 RepID=UPI0011AE2C15|nr:hypothetical protein [Mangrovicoccus ximenensis]